MKTTRYKLNDKRIMISPADLSKELFEFFKLGGTMSSMKGWAEAVKAVDRCASIYKK